MESPAAARLSAVGAHLASAAAEPAPPEPSDGALSGDEIAAFVARGFHVVDTRGDISAEFHAAFAARSREINDRPRQVPLQDVGFLELEEDMAVVLRCPSVRGALSSLLGSDFAMACAWAEDLNNGGMMGNHHTAVYDNDQAYHKCAPARVYPANVLLSFAAAQGRHPHARLRRARHQAARPDSNVLPERRRAGARAHGRRPGLPQLHAGRRPGLGSGPDARVPRGPGRVASEAS